jgi:hypothetical protein
MVAAGTSETAAVAAIAAAGRALHLPTVRRLADELADADGRDGTSPRGSASRRAACSVQS